MALFAAKPISKEDYCTASQMQLVWARFKKNRSATIAMVFLVFFILRSVFASFIDPYDPTAAGRNPDYTNGAQQIPQFCDANGCSLRPFIHKVERYRGAGTNFRWVTRATEEQNYLTFLPKGDEYLFLGIEMDRHLFGVEEGFIHISGASMLPAKTSLAARSTPSGYPSPLAPWASSSRLSWRRS